jgi:hypothetical protein
MITFSVSSAADCRATEGTNGVIDVVGTRLRHSVLLAHQPKQYVWIVLLHQLIFVSIDLAVLDRGRQRSSSVR